MNAIQIPGYDLEIDVVLISEYDIKVRSINIGVGCKMDVVLISGQDKIDAVLTLGKDKIGRSVDIGVG